MRLRQPTGDTYQAEAVSHCGAYLLGVHVLHAAFIRRGAAVLPIAGAAHLKGR